MLKTGWLARGALRKGLDGDLGIAENPQNRKWAKLKSVNKKLGKCQQRQKMRQSCGNGEISKIGKNGDAEIAQNLGLAKGESPLAIWALRPTPELGISGRPMVAKLKDIRAVEFPRNAGKSRE